MSKLFIPKRVRIGFQERKDTFSNRLGYVIYYDQLNRLRKEKSWEGWRSKEIEPVEFDNVPFNGFMINKGFVRHSWSDFGKPKARIRMFDPRSEFEFEISPENLTGLLMHTNCFKRQIDGDVVYAWSGTELVLLPCSSEEYQSSVKFTQLQATKVSAKSLVPGAIYMNRSERHMMYLGHYMYYEVKDGGSTKIARAAREAERNRRDGKRSDLVFTDPRVGQKQHMFCYVESLSTWNKKKQAGAWFPVKSVSADIAAVVNEHCDDRFAEYLAFFREHADHWAIVGYEKRDLPKDYWELKPHPQYHWETHNVFTEYNGKYYQVNIRRTDSRNTSLVGPNDYFLINAHKRLNDDGGHDNFDSSGYNNCGFDIGLNMPYGNGYDTWGRRYHGPVENVIDKSKYFDLDYVFGNGMKKPIIDRSEWNA